MTHLPVVGKEREEGEKEERGGWERGEGEERGSKRRERCMGEGRGEREKEREREMYGRVEIRGKEKRV